MIPDQQLILIRQYFSENGFSGTAASVVQYYASQGLTINVSQVLSEQSRWKIRDNREKNEDAVREHFQQYGGYYAADEVRKILIRKGFKVSVQLIKTIGDSMLGPKWKGVTNDPKVLAARELYKLCGSLDASIDELNNLFL